MGNPWTDPELARRWVSMAKPGNATHAEQLGIVLALVRARHPRRLLDLGCGPGDVTMRLLAELPAARVVCLDGSTVMLERARAALEGRDARFVAADVREPWAEAVGPVDCVTALNVIHHLEDAEKRAVFAQVGEVLQTGGLFLLNDRVSIDPRLMRFHTALWDRARRVHDHPPLRSDYDHAAYVADNDRAGDVPGRLDAQLDWLRQAGFEPVTCFWQHANRAVFGGLRV